MCIKNIFIEKACEVHGKNRYSYDKSDYVNSKAKITIICPEHGEFQQTPANHLRGNGCPECSKNKKRRTYTNEQFIERAIMKHGNKYDYSKAEYVNNFTPITIICPEHGEFQQTPHNHLSGHGCKKCPKKQRIDNNFIEKSIEIHGEKYDYSKTVYVNSYTPVIIICKHHGEFKQLPRNHLRGNGCKKCAIIKRRPLLK